MSVPVSPAAAARELTRNAPPRSDHGLQEGCDIPQYGGLPVGKQHSAANPGPVREHLTSLVGSQQSLFLERRKCCGSPTKPRSDFLVGLRKSSTRRSQNPEDAAAQRHGQWPPPNGGPPRAWQCHNDMWDNHTAASAAVRAALDYDTNTYADLTISHIARSPVAQKLYIHLTWHAVHAPYTPAPLSESIKPDDDAFSNYCPPPGTPPAAVSGGLERCNFGQACTQPYQHSLLWILCRVADGVQTSPGSLGKSLPGSAQPNLIRSALWTLCRLRRIRLQESDDARKPR